jgi:ABC-2 type transport system ATP-binding protein
MEEAERLCDRVAVIAGGRIVATGTPRDLTRSSLEDVILRLTAP